jgi:hypothetical protein
MWKKNVRKPGWAWMALEWGPEKSIFFVLKC